MPKYITIKTYKRKIRDPVENKLSAKKAANARWEKYRQMNGKKVTIITQHGKEEKVMTKKQFDKYVNSFGRDGNVDYDWNDGVIEYQEE